MARESIASQREVHTEGMPIDQRAVPEDLSERDGDVILVDPAVAKKAWLDELAFMEEPVTIRLEPSSDENAVQVFACWVNGKGAEILRGGRWYELKYLPIGEVITIKRKYLEVIARAKIDTIRTPAMSALAANPDNRPTRRTHSVNTFSVLEDRNPRGGDWLTEMMRRNF